MFYKHPIFSHPHKIDTIGDVSAPAVPQYLLCCYEISTPLFQNIGGG
jgi:hypothetical protein